MTLTDAYGALEILLVVTAATFLAEAASWAIVYRRADYKRACSRVRDLSRKLEKEDARESLVAVDKKKQYEKNLTRMEAELKEATAKMNGMKLTINIGAAVAFFFLYRNVAAKWTGKSIATLPFFPLRIVQNLSHRGLDGDNFYECSFGFIYTLCTMGLKQNIPKLLGFAAPRSAYNLSRVATQAQKESEKDN